MSFHRHGVCAGLQSLCAVLMVAYLPGVDLAKGSKSSTIAGPWWALPIQQVNCTPGSSTNEVTVELKFLSEPRSSTELQRVSSVFSFPNRPMDDTIHSTVKFDVFSKDRWKENAIAPMNFRRGGCTAFHTLIPDYFHKLFGVPPGSKEPCFVKAGRYEFTDQLINWTFPSLPYFFYGHYRLFMSGGQGPGEQMCFGVEFKVNPR